MIEGGINYHDYLKLDDILNCQHMLSVEKNRPAHDEMLFIVIHQTYELWFKQMIHELDSVLEIFNKDHINEKQMGVVNSRLHRIFEIIKVLEHQIQILETMTPLDFLEFRDLLYPASGFQSLQFRIFENKLGLKPDQRMPFNQSHYHAHFPEQHVEALKKVESEKSLFDCVEKWLERTPFLEMEGFDFWQEYTRAVRQMFEKETTIIQNNSLLSDKDKKRNFEIIKNSANAFESIFDEQKYNELKKQNQWRLSFKAVSAALLIQLYRDQPVFQQAFQLMTNIINVDEIITSWRYKHSLMARRMLGSKIGTGGSSGAEYLKASTEKHKIFNDFFQLTTFFIPRSLLPELPQEVEEKLGFYYSKK